LGTWRVPVFLLADAPRLLHDPLDNVSGCNYIGYMRRRRKS
jgi:hypothetical protein